MKSKRQELEEVEKEIENILSPLYKLQRKLRDELNEEFKNSKMEHYARVAEGKIFYGNHSTWSGFNDVTFLIKPISCEDWSSYNMCNVVRLEIRKNNKGTTISFIEDTERVDSFETHYKQLTPDIASDISTLLSKEIGEILSNFIF